VLLLATCATIPSCDDFDDIVAWGENHLDFLRRFSGFHFGIVRSPLNRVDPVLFGRASIAGSRRFGRTGATSWPSTARQPDHRKRLKPCTRSHLTHPTDPLD
jgi:hypothetical protein